MGCRSGGVILVCNPDRSLPTPKAIERRSERSATGSTLAISPFACHTMARAPRSKISDPVDRIVSTCRGELISCFHQVFASYERGGTYYIAPRKSSEDSGPFPLALASIAIGAQTFTFEAPGRS